MAKAREADVLLPVLDFLETTTGASPDLTSYGSGKRRVQVARFDDYPSAGLTTFVTVGASRVPVTTYRGLQVGFELTLTLATPDPDTADDLAKAVLENLRVADSDQRRPFIEYNGIFAPGYPPHLLFTEQLTCTPQLSGRKRCGDRWVSFLSAIPLGDDELREYDQSVPTLIARLGKDGQLEKYPRRRRTKRRT
jgi:hypothetical protein